MLGKIKSFSLLCDRCSLNLYNNYQLLRNVFNSMESSNSSRNDRVSNHACRSSNFGRHPSHLSGKAIGLWYAQRRRPSKSTQVSTKARTPSTQAVATIELSPSEIQQVTKIHQLFNCQRKSRKNFDGSLSDIELDDALIDDTKHAVHFEKLHTSFQYFEFLARNPFVDQHLLDDLRKKQCSSLYRKLNIQRTRLPITDYRQQILNTIRENQIFILVGETGSGKSLQNIENFHSSF